MKTALARFGTHRCTTRSALLALVVAFACAIRERPAQACGGCFSRPTENTVVTDHRMAFSVSTQQTVLWDQIKYSGDPTEFSWVLPVRPGAVVELSHDEWFAALDATTSPSIAGPVLNCGGRSTGGCVGFVGGSSKSAGFSTGTGPGVQVISQTVVGPYDTVTLQSTDPNALDTWLNANGFFLPDTFRPTVAGYVTAGFDFIALRLRPDQGVQSMQPVRIVTPGADATLPLRMVAAGVGAQVGITLYVISEGRYEAKAPFFNDVIEDSKLVWFQPQGRSNYQELSQQLMQNHNGRTWLTEYSQPTSLAKSPFGLQPFCGASFGAPFAQLYLGQCKCKPAIACGVSGASEGGSIAPAPATAADDAPSSDATNDAAASDAAFTEATGDDPTNDATASDAISSDATGDDATGDGASSDSTGPGDANGTSTPDAACNSDPCAGFDDVDTALVGMHADSTWVTRLRAVLPVDALSEGDLQIQASATQSIVSSQHATNTFSNPKDNPCGTQSGCSAIAARTSFFEKWLVLGAFAFAGAALLRRRSRRTPR